MNTPPSLPSALDDRYIIERELGSGGMAVVYLARDRKLDREVALKVLRPELGAVLGGERFLAEIKISAKLDHPHILTLIDSGEADGFLYYVLPYVRGESLRDRLTREHQLGLDEAVSITRQVASALDYAHRQGLVHRDIKPENILLQEGEAMLADFGIALAVKEAGGNRLTQTGLSLGTPQYMSPEQATGDRGIDARSDVYSLAAVLYEMIAGEPPVSGASAQSMIAKLMTERPTHLRVLRDTVSEEMDAAVAKALSKTPADRFASAGEFVHALEARNPVNDMRGDRHPRAIILAGVAAFILVAIGAAVANSKRHTDGGPPVLGRKTQLTSTGGVLAPAISGDGKQLAYLNKKCTTTGCIFSVVVQDVGGTTTRTILDGAAAGDRLEWSPDRRNLLFRGIIASRAGVYLLSALGGPARFLNTHVAEFYAGGDSLLLGPAMHPDSVFWIRVAGLDGIARDSIRVAGPGQALASLSTVPGTNWILTLVLQRPHGLWQVIGRDGKVAGHVVNACMCGGLATSDAVWLARAGESEGEAVVRIALDRTNGHLAARQDTMTRGLFTQFSLTSDGAGMVMDEGTYEHDVWAVPFDDALKARFTDEHRIAHSSSLVRASVSPDGSRILVYRRVPTSNGQSEGRYAVMPFAGGADAALPVPGEPVGTVWSDSVTVAVSTLTPHGLHFSQVDVRSGAQRDGMDLPDSTVTTFAPIDSGWAWIPASADRVIVVEHGRRREFQAPAWYGAIYQLIADSGRHRIVTLGRGAATGDSVRATTFPLTGGSPTMWPVVFGTVAGLSSSSTHAAIMRVAQRQSWWTFFALEDPGQITVLGTIPRAVNGGISLSDNGTRVTVGAREYHADAWLYQVQRP